VRRISPYRRKLDAGKHVALFLPLYKSRAERRICKTSIVTMVNLTPTLLFLWNQGAIFASVVIVTSLSQ